MADLTGFNANQYEDDALVLDPIKPGTYVAVITDSEMHPTAKGNGQFLLLTLQIIEGEYKGRKVWDRLNLINPSEAAMDIARRNLAAICRAVGVLTPKDSSELHDKPLQVRVAQRKREDNGEIVNDVKAYAASQQAQHARRIEAKDVRAGVEAALSGKARKETRPAKGSGGYDDSDIPF